MRTQQLTIARWSLLGCLAATLLYGCAYFVSHYDAGAYQNFTNLKAYHLKFIEDMTQGPKATWSKDTITADCDTGSLKFREAFEYANGMHDKTRTDAVGILHEQFNKDCNDLLSEKRLFSSVFSKELRDIVAKNYDLAIAGELTRLDAPSNGYACAAS